MKNEFNIGKVGSLTVVEHLDGDVVVQAKHSIFQPSHPPVWRDIEAPRFEKIMGVRSTLLPIDFLTRGIRASRAVVRIVTPAGIGSGFLVDDEVLVTNNHVIPDEAAARDAQIEFNYQKTIDGTDEVVERCGLDPASAFRTSEADDWTIVRVKGSPNERWGTLRLVDSRVDVDDPVNIIQHPGGAPKHIAMYHNLVTYSDDRIVQYLTDTLPGSSGSPVFNDRWDVVAIHHAGGLLPQPGSKTMFFRNEGIRSVLVLEALRAMRSS